VQSTNHQCLIDVLKRGFYYCY